VPVAPVAASWDPRGCLSDGLAEARVPTATTATIVAIVAHHGDHARRI
jgi:hypothetical protein